MRSLRIDGFLRCLATKSSWNRASGFCFVSSVIFTFPFSFQRSTPYTTQIVPPSSRVKRINGSKAFCFVLFVNRSNNSPSRFFSKSQFNPWRFCHAAIATSKSNGLCGASLSLCCWRIILSTAFPGFSSTRTIYAKPIEINKEPGVLGKFRREFGSSQLLSLWYF